MEILSKEQSKEKIKKIASTFDKIISVVKILLIIGIVFSIMFAIAFFVLGVTDQITEIYEKHPKLFEHIDLNKKDDALMFIKHGLSIEEVYANGDLDRLALGYSVLFVSYAFIFVITILLCYYVQKVFRKLTNNESPFNENLLKPFKVLFIVITIFVIFKSIVIGILVGGILACMYFIYLYGCNMQNDEDHTL